MNKVERINTMMRYINNRAHFTISEIMSEFNISRSTAIRDINEIETIGIPLVSEVGRSGGYFVMNNSFLPAIRFTNNEVKALFIAFMATRNQQLPYLSSRQSLAEKLIGLIPENQQDDLVNLNQMLLFEGTNPYNPDLLDLSDLPHPILEKLIQTFLIDRYLILTINEEKKLIQIKFYLVHLYKEKNSWHLEGLDLTSKNKRKFQVDSLEDVEIYPTKSRLSAKQIQEHMTKIEKAPNIIIEMGLEAILQFKKYSPYRLSLFYINPFQTKALLKIVVDVTKQAELVEMANWLLFLGEDMHIKKLPKEIEDYIKTKKLVNR
ncbi:HTH domain-containing protein [Carnobacterium maltaromaticum]|uniref:HTH domain-containing protein n=1 Tax=Carnobacterium maltaromaticum TaxID=2751 RepID=A0AAW9JNW7_CARML|nr:HTH domain-containing protein [Carnobacterium maltaromaticum]MDZ5757173.1 HTH domain-containing protein [Carnobacterium maltaromaticum]